MKIILKQRRNMRGWSVRELAKKSAISKNTISNIENDKVSPTLFTLEQLSRALECKVKDLFVE